MRIRPAFSFFTGAFYFLLTINARLLLAQPVADTTIISENPEPVIESAIIKEAVNTRNLKTIQLGRSDLELAYPVILLNSEDELLFSFDDLRGGVVNYYYTFQHCNQNWEPSNLTYFDYLDGFEENRFDDYQFSFGTSQHYTHYSVSFPNDDVDFKMSGNYILKIWEEDDRDTPVIVKRFFVWEELAIVSATVFRPNIIEYRNEFQELSFNVNIKNTGISNPFDEIRVTAMQNGRFDNARYDLKPRMITNDMLYYDNDANVFPAGKEYRRFDTKTLHFQSDRIRKIEKDDAGYQVYINVDESRIYQKYFYEKDINGQFVIQADIVNDINTEGDYAWMHFVLQYPYFITSGEFYVFGNLTNQLMNNENKMEYDFDLQQYSVNLYLKQGYYNYLYGFKSAGSEIAEFNFAEGNFYETENDYQVLVYQHVYDRGYDRLIGCSFFNSLKK
ncbi:MAG: DUF5103 domain-containing protein [Chitinophagales bacterium]